MAFLVALGVSAAISGASATLYNNSPLNHSCVLAEPVLSCSPRAVPSKVDTCCVETYGGLVMSTQFWDTYTGLESQGQKLPQHTWTNHGLWPDYCDGTYTQYCDLKRQYDPVPSPNTTNGLPNGTVVPPYSGPNVGTFLEAFGRYDLLEYMNKFWIAQNQPNYELWAHEFSKHATCFSTFDLPCYGPKYREHEELVEYFEAAVMYYKRLPTWGWLATKSIYPSNSTTYTLSDIQSALKSGYGGQPFVGCSGPRYNTTAAGKGSQDRGYTVLSEVWYYSHVYGRPQNGQSIPLDVPPSYITNCATTKGAIQYPTRSTGSEVPIADQW